MFNAIFEKFVTDRLDEDMNTDTSRENLASDLAQSIEDAKNDDELIYVLQHIRKEALDSDVIRNMSEESKDRVLGLLFRFFSTIPELRNY